ncbi:apical endosomal glycoprotein isoform X2 [Chanos chanos]|uniref:Apical endosomal glycoprotein isoform X2 n=1 Tax=Chanos chanos TaxID=29144 RepID=A0A6J2UWQ6_CHACN|nr:apical endosomal glycoprotein isoform X2 [Chanos chanos]
MKRAPMGSCNWILVLSVLIYFQQVTGLERTECHTDKTCDFVCDCTRCSDEQGCGYKGPDFICDFEDSDMCGWTDTSVTKTYAWERRQRGASLPDSGPSSDYTTGTSTGWFMGVTEVKVETPRDALLTSPRINQSAPTCRLKFQYFIWDSGHTGLGDSSLYVSVIRQDGKKGTVWRSEGTSIRGWREATAFLGRIPEAFHIQIHSRRQEGKPGDVAIDQLEFLNCALPVSSAACGAESLLCRHGGCVEKHQVCDGTDDCGDGTDEESCGEYMRCDFEEDLCGWDLRTIITSVKWTRTSQINISISDPLDGPGRDHTTNTESGHFLYLTKPDVFKSDWSFFQSPLLDPTNSSHPCRMVMYTHQFGPVSGGLSVLVAGEKIEPVWERGGSLGDLWVKAEVEFVVNSTFQILFVGAIRDREYGGIAIDNIILSPECRLSSGIKHNASFPQSPGNPCTDDINKMCNFKKDCESGEDEAKCGDFSYANGSSGWTDTSIGSQGWELHREVNGTPMEEFLHVTAAAGQQLSEAQTRTPLLGPSGPSCTLQFSYSLTGNNAHIGKVSVGVVDSVLGTQPSLWEFSGTTGQEHGVWLEKEVYVGARGHRFQLEFRARATELNGNARIAVKDVHFLNCHPEYLPSSPTDLSCNFETGLCGWYQDQTDNYDWILQSGMDHTISTGSSLVVDMWDPSLRGLSGRLLSFTREPANTQHCLSFYYKLYGPQTGGLNVKVLYADGVEQLLWTRSGAHGNRWHEGHCTVPPQLTAFQLMFEAVRSGFDGQVAIDDLAFVPGSCALPNMCSFEGQNCGYTSTGTPSWVLQSWASSETGPKTDHTLDTKTGYYMMIHSGTETLPQGSVSTLTSPVHRGVDYTECLQFWYYMGGDNPGSLNVFVKPVKGDRIKLFSSSVNQGDVWRHASANIDWHGDWQLQFEVEGAGGKETHIAVDDIILLSHSCPSLGDLCDLEHGLCGWSNTQNTELDLLDWELTSVSVETKYPTPPYDHTLSNERGHFLSLPHTERATEKYNAWLLSPYQPPTKGSCLSFWVHQPTYHDSTLKVLRLSGHEREELLSLTEVEGGVWKYFKIDVTSDTEYQIVFEGLKGEKGVLALDDITFTVGINCAGKVTDPQTTSSSSDNTAGIVASVIVLILLLITLSGILVFCLRIREKARALTEQTTSVDNSGFSNDLYEPTNVPDRVTVNQMPIQGQDADVRI